MRFPTDRCAGRGSLAVIRVKWASLRVRPLTPPACRAWMALDLGEGTAKPGASAMGEDYKEQLDDFKRKMEKHRTQDSGAHSRHPAAG